MKHKNRQIAVYRVVENALNAFTNGRYRDGDVLCDAVENMVNGFMDERISNKEDMASITDTISRKEDDTDGEKWKETERK